jgi:magnesium transporter
VTDSDQLTIGGPPGIAAAIAEASSRRYLPLLDALDERIEAMEEDAIAGDPSILGDSQALRRDVILLRRTLGPQREVVLNLSRSISPLFSDETRRSFADVYDHYFRLVESLDAARALLGGVMETYRGAVAERTNEVMKVLTVFSAVLLPLGLIAGLWGMNFADVPGSGWRWGFVGLLGIMATIAVGLWVYFARRGFVGGPKLRDLPKAVGLGLVHVGTAPLRAVAGRWPTGRGNGRSGEGQ